ncbi:MAG: hypothetical protein JW944_06220 [Deltaproteobacteria bacterium]|nr:hypothetical protein [Deltaproteobacteria bacterium]
MLKSFLLGDKTLETFEDKKETLTVLKDSTSLRDGTISKLWAEHAMKLNRYELIKIISMKDKPSIWKTSDQDNGPQLSLRFKKTRSGNNYTDFFRMRIQAIREK